MVTTNRMFALFLFIASCSKANSEPLPVAVPPVAVRVITVERGVLPRMVRAVGRLAYKRSLSLGFKNGGTITQLLVQEGAVVRRGQRLAVVDPTEVNAQVSQARASMDKADRELVRVETLEHVKAVTRQELENAHTAVELAHAAHAAALYNQTVAVLVAPEDGRIDKRLAEVGEQVAPGRPIFTMSGSAAGLVVRVGVVDRDLPGIRLGDIAQVQVDALAGRTFTAQVSEIATTPSIPAGTYEVELRLNAVPEHALAAGMTAKVELPRPPGEAQPIVPLGALIDADGLHAQLYTLVEGTSGQTVSRVQVKLAYVVGESAAIAEGLSGGERIVSEGASFVEPGRVVRAVEASHASR